MSTPTPSSRRRKIDPELITRLTLIVVVVWTALITVSVGVSY
jgi:hypothetical protein